ncbi:linker for activation of T-cells family member 1 isoform X1 [Marmota monax]|uniref:linker for activation of T-cells family member 1 isoform X1 n=1 Tax=Marmota monax TaxID=9995 RepID=UPI001EB08A68|nr:linker for activation of T-cells family member 1 isoform X1 [Marmota monax]
MEVDGLTPYPLGLLLLPLLAMLLIALCVRCHEPPDSYDSAPADSSNPTSILIKPPYTPVPWPPAASYPPVISYPPPSQPDLLPIPRSPQPPVGSHRMPPSQQDSDGANSMASYENQGASGISRPRARWGSWHLSQVMLTPVSLSPEPACEDADEDDDEDDYHNPGYLMVLPDSTPATSPAAPSAPVPSDPGLRDSTFSSEFSISVYLLCPMCHLTFFSSLSYFFNDGSPSVLSFICWTSCSDLTFFFFFLPFISPLLSPLSFSCAVVVWEIS